MATSTRLLFVSALAAAALACVPAPGGQCAADSDCRVGTTCQRGLCRPPPPEACETACAAGFHCAGRACAPDVAPAVSWAAPEDGAWHASGAVAVALSVGTSLPIASVAVVAERPRSAGLAGAGEVGKARVALAQGTDGLWRGLLDPTSLDQGEWRLVPLVRVGEADTRGADRGLRIDRSGPAITLSFPTPPGGFFRRTGTLTFTASIADDGAGLDETTPVLLAPGLQPIAGARVSATDWSFAVPLAKPTFLAAQGPLALRVEARDRLGNTGAATGAVPVTRTLWQQQAGGGLPVRSSPVVDRAHLYVGTDARAVVALDRATGVALWSRPLAGAVSGSPALGHDALYAASEGGEVVAIEPATGAVRWSCAQLAGQVRFTSSPAVARFDAGEGVFLSSETDALRGGVVAVQGSGGFPTQAGLACLVTGAFGGGRSSPAVAADGALYVGGVDRRLHRLRLREDQSSAAFVEEWSSPTADDVVSPAVLANGDVLFGDQLGTLRLLTAGGQARWTPDQTLGETLLSSPLAAFSTALALGDEGGLGAWSLGGSEPYVPQRLQAGAIESTPAVGADGTLYVAAGHTLRALSPAGALLWEAPLGGDATASSPTLGCDGTLYVGDGAGAITALATDSQGLAPGGWPRFRHDARGTGNAASPVCE